MDLHDDVWCICMYAMHKTGASLSHHLFLSTATSLPFIHIYIFFLLFAPKCRIYDVKKPCN